MMAGALRARLSRLNDHAFAARCARYGNDRLRHIGQMPWDSHYFPPSMRHLGDATREKAIAIANALLAEGMEEGMAIRIAIAKAKQWARRHGVPVRDDAA
jgi:hypothetical protein